MVMCACVFIVPFVCLFRSQAIHSCEHPQRSGFLRARPFVLPPQGQSCSFRGDLTCMLRIFLYRRESIEGERRAVGNVSFRWWRKPECLERTTSQPQVTNTFSLMDDHIGENLIELRWLQPIQG